MFSYGNCQNRYRLFRFTNWCVFQGRYVAKWDRGKLIEGNYFFYDNLEYIDSEKAMEEAANCKTHHNSKKENDTVGWDYCTARNRQFYTEISRGTLRPEGKTLLSNDIKGTKTIPEGTYDVGDGYYDPIKRCICEYDANFKRDLDEGEEKWIIEKCRYEPQIHDAADANLDGSND